MTVIVVGGHSRNVGKTSVAAGLIRAFHNYHWTAVKISSHRHANVGLRSEESKHCFCEIYEEQNRDGTTDTSRFLAAGARRSLWVRIDELQAEAGMRQLFQILEQDSYVMIESNRVLRYMRPDLYLMVLNFSAREFKKSARELLGMADGIVAVNPDRCPAPWEDLSATLSGIPQFITADPQSIPPGLIDLVQARLHK